MKDKRIGIFGPSGSGKTTTAKFINEVYGIPYLHTDGPELRKKYGCNSHRELVTLSIVNPFKGLCFQHDLLDERLKLAMTHDNFVMDRSPVDNMAYFLLQNSAVSKPEVTERFLERAGGLLDRYTHLIGIPALYDKPEDDGVRIQNLYYQQMTWRIMEWIVSDFISTSTLVPKILVLDNYDLAWRKKEIMGFIS